LSYSATYDGVTMTFNFETEVVSIDAGTSFLPAETLQKGARDAEESITGIVYRRIIDASGKVTLDAQSETGLTVTLLRNWKILSLKTSGLLSVGGGNVVNENTGVLIFASNPQVDTQNNTSVAGVRVTTDDGGGSNADVELLLKYHDNQTRFFLGDGVTEVPQASAVRMTIYDDDDTTPLKTIEFRDSSGTPVTLPNATRYVKL